MLAWVSVVDLDYFVIMNERPLFSSFMRRTCPTLHLLEVENYWTNSHAIPNYSLVTKITCWISFVEAPLNWAG